MLQHTVVKSQQHRYTRNNYVKGGFAMVNVFGEYLKQLRLSRNLTLRSFCEANGFDPGNYSRLERGLLPPPRDENKLEPYRSALNLEASSLEWLELRRLAAIGRGEIPATILTNVEIAQKLPAFFRTLEGGSVNPEELEELIKTLRG